MTFDKETYRRRSIVEQYIGWLKECRRIGNPRQLLRTALRPSLLLVDRHLRQHRFQARRIVDLTRRHFDIERRAVALDEDVELAAEPAAGTAQRVVRRFVGVRLETLLTRAPRVIGETLHVSPELVASYHE